MWSEFSRIWVTFWKKIGFVLPSSPWLARDMVRYVDWENAKNIIELGTGGGIVTRHILARMRPDATLVSLELDPDMYERAKEHIRDPRVTFLCANALDITQYVPEDSANLVISTLPLGSLGVDISTRILVQISLCLCTSGEYFQYQYFKTNEKQVREIFNMRSIYIQYFNIPPAFIYSCTKK
jgi:phospholipid N-methyltransferase